MASADKESVSSATARRVRRFMARPEAGVWRLGSRGWRVGSRGWRVSSLSPPERGEHVPPV